MAKKVKDTVEKKKNYRKTSGLCMLAGLIVGAIVGYFSNFDFLTSVAVGMITGLLIGYGVAYLK